MHPHGLHRFTLSAILKEWKSNHTWHLENRIAYPLPTRLGHTNQVELPFIQPDIMAKSKMPLGPVVTTDKNGRTLYWMDRKRVTQAVYQAKKEPQLPKLPPRTQPTVMDRLDSLLQEVRRHFQPQLTALEQKFLGTMAHSTAGYRLALEIAGSPMAANALIGSLQRKGYIRYESKEDARFRLISTQDRYYHLTSPEVQKARVIELTKAI